MNINKILFLFLSVVLLSIFGLWQFAHTKKFAGFLSSKLQTTLFKSFNGKVSFESIEIGIFPLTTKIKNVSLKTGDSSEKNIYCRFDEVGFYFSLMDLLSSQLSIDKMILDNGFVKYEDEGSLSNSPDNELGIKKIFSYYKNTREGKLLQMVKTIQIKNSKLNGVVDVDDVKIRTYNNYLVLTGNLAEVNVGKFQEGPGWIRENINLSLEIERGGIRIKSFGIKDELEEITFKGELVEREKKRTLEGNLHYRGRLKKIFDMVKMKIPKKDEFSGYIDADAHISGNIKNLDFKVDFRGERIETPYFLADEMHASFDVMSGMIVVNKVDLKRDRGMLRLLRPVEMFDLKNGNIVPGNARFRVDNFFTNEAFMALDFMDILKGRISGDVGVEWAKERRCGYFAKRIVHKGIQNRFG